MIVSETNGTSSARRQRTPPVSGSTTTTASGARAPQLVPLYSLHPAPWNPRSIDRARLRSLAESIKADPTFLWVRPILANRQGEIFAGNQRWYATELLFSEGWVPPWGGSEASVPADVDDVDPKLARERGLRDNNSWGAWLEEELAMILANLDQQGTDTSTLGFDRKELVQFMARLDGQRADLQPDDADLEPPEAPLTQIGDIWTLGEHRLVCGDARDPHDLERLMGHQVATAIWTDPPYGVDYVGKTADALTIQGDTAEGLPRLLDSAFAALTPFLRKGASFYIASPAGPLGTEFRLALRRADWQLHETLVWVKQHFVLGHSDYHYQHEDILYGWTKGGDRRFSGDRTLSTLIDEDIVPSKLTKADLVHYVEDLRGRIPSSVLREDRPSASPDHPTRKPVRLVRRCLANSAQRPDLVLDPFAGSGSTLIACEELGLRARVLDIDPAYCDVVVRRWERVTGEIATRA